MKHADRMLLHSIDAATNGTHPPGKAARVLVWAALLVGSHAVLFVLGCVVTRALVCAGH